MAFNVPFVAFFVVGLTAGTGPEQWRRVMTSDVLPRLDAFKPDIIFISAGFDGHHKVSQARHCIIAINRAFPRLFWEVLGFHYHHRVSGAVLYYAGMLARVANILKKKCYSPLRHASLAIHALSQGFTY